MPDRSTDIKPTKLVLQHRTALYAYIFLCVRSYADAEDIFQDVSVAIVDSIDQLRDEDGFLPWAREIAFRRIMAHKRKSKSGREYPVDPHVIAALADASDRSEQSHHPAGDRRVALMECLDKLPARSRELIALRYDDAVKNVEQIADQLRLSVQAVYSKIKRIKRMLRECVERSLAAERSR